MSHRCFWPGCRVNLTWDRAFCPRHLSRLPENVRGWVKAQFTADAFRVKGSEARKAVGAGVSYARKHPDPELPPFRHGDRIRGKAGNLFQSCVYTVDTCVLNDRNQWLAIAADSGEQFLAAEMELHT